MVLRRVYNGKTFNELLAKHYIYPVFTLIEHKTNTNYFSKCLRKCLDKPEDRLIHLKDLKLTVSQLIQSNILASYTSRHNLTEMAYYIVDFMDVLIYIEENKLLPDQNKIIPGLNDIWNTDIFLLRELVKSTEVENIDLFKYIELYCDFITKQYIQS